jgi:hypothetical protein
VLVAAVPPTADWAAVDQALSQGLPKTAIERLEPIIQRARAANQHAEATRAIALKVSLEGNIQGNRPEEKIRRMRAEIEQAPGPMRPAMNAILANWFWHYYQQNRWRFLERTQTSEPPGDDFTTWDLVRILGEIDTQFQATLADAEQLQKIPVGDYDLLLDKGSAPDAYRPTLFDVLAHNALEFYSAGEQAGSRSEDAFDLLADSPIFAPASDFLGWQPQTSDTQSLTLRAVQLYQQLLRFHQDDDDRSALLDADLLRLNFGHDQAFGEDKSARYQSALRRFADEHAAHEISARALHELATVIQEEGDLVKARVVALEGMQRFADSVGGRRCFNLIQQIESRSSQVTTERVWNDPRPTIDVRYRNLTQIHFRLVRFDFQNMIASRQRQPDELDQDQRRALLGQRPVRSWSEELPPTADYQERVERLASPEDLAAGSYFLIASHNAAFSDVDNQVSFCEVWVSDLAIVSRNHQSGSLADGFVLHAGSGQPIAAATVQVWRRGNENRWLPLPAITTDSNGQFKIRSSDHQQLLLLVTHQGQSLSSTGYLRTQESPKHKPFQRTVFFTDRSLYRPGQTIRYKGICLAVNSQQDKYQTISRQKVTVLFKDVNGNEVERFEHRTNDHGSFSGSATVPRDRLMGSMSLEVAAGPPGSTTVTVEEYKRPKFLVELDPPAAAARLGEAVTLTGKATAYTGAPIDGAQVRWRVVREVRYPVWWFYRRWWLPPQPGGSQEVAHGRSTTSSVGTFEITFTARPDASVPAESEPTFHYSIHADVTDTAGETRSSQRSVRIGYTELSATLTSNDWLTDKEKIEIRVSTTTLDGAGQQASGMVRIHAVEQPPSVTRAPLSRNDYWPRGDAESDPANPNSWPLGEMVHEAPFQTAGDGTAVISTMLAAGLYRAQLETRDRAGKPVTAELPLRVLDPEAKQLNLKLPDLFAMSQDTLEPGEKFLALWGSGYDSARAFVEVEHRGKLLQQYWTEPQATQASITQQVDESMRGGFTVRTTMVRENRAYTHSQHINVPWSNKQLRVTWEHVVSKLAPAAKETWTAVVSGPDAEPIAAEMVATMYDASLDAYRPHHWPDSFQIFRTDLSRVYSMFQNHPIDLQPIYYTWQVQSRDDSLSYRSFPAEILQNFFGYDFPGAMRGEAMAMESTVQLPTFGLAPAAKGRVAGRAASADAAGADGGLAVGQAMSSTVSQPTPSPDLSSVSARKNLSETAFFFPHLIAGQDGKVQLEFSMPEALTRWRFLGFAHDRQLRSGLLTDSAVTTKNLMVQPNPPRFLRAGDIVEFTVKVSNQSPTRQSGTVRLTFHDARTSEAVDARLGNQEADKLFEIPAGESTSLSWRLSIPDDVGALTYKAVGSSGRLSDGEEGLLPVLSRRVLVTESLPLPVRGKQTRAFEFTKLLESGNSDSLQHQSLTVQMVSHPSWYAVLALPYLMEYPHECSEQTFNRLYANALARHIAASNPKIHRVFEQWRGTKALDSPLEKNQEIQSVLIEETPWLRQAQDESQARRNIGVLFDDNRLNDEMGRALHQLSQLQLEDGAWPWFPGGRANDYITLYITTGFGRLRHLGVEIDTGTAIRSLERLDRWAASQYERLQPAERKVNQLTSTIALYLYGRSFFLQDQAVAPEHRAAVEFWLAQARQHWLELGHRQSQAHLAVALKRFGSVDAAQGIVRSLQERSVSDDELGMYWRELEQSWWWYRAPIETQAMMIEVFDEVADDQQAVEDCKVWLLQQKQTHDWKTTKATADAIYALLLRGSDALASDALVEMTVGGQTLRPENVAAGTGFYEQRFAGGEIKPAQGQISVRKLDDGVAWGSVHWQYLEEIGKITPYEGTPLKLTKQLYVKRNTPQGPTLEALNGAVEVGDELVVRIVLSCDRDMEYVHLKDHRGSGTEPVNVLSRYKYQDGLGYYESTRDTASHFFIDYLPKGRYVLEYSTRVQLRGEYQSGMASIQCMYAPQFNSHSQSLPIRVQ